MSEKNWNIGDRVQRVEDYGRVKTGTVSALIESDKEVYRFAFGSMRSREKKTEKFVSELTVKWDDGTEETSKCFTFRPEDSELEREFRSFVPSANERINEKLDLASRYLREATEISEETGIPFDSNISFLSQGYAPTSFKEKFAEISSEVVEELTQVYDLEWSGWRHSAIC